MFDHGSGLHWEALILHSESPPSQESWVESSSKGESSLICAGYIAIDWMKYSLNNMLLNYFFLLFVYWKKNIKKNVPMFCSLFYSFYFFPIQIIELIIKKIIIFKMNNYLVKV